MPVFWAAFQTRTGEKHNNDKPFSDKRCAQTVNAVRLLRYYHDEYTYTFVKTHKYTTQKVNTSVNYGLL